MTKKLSKKNKLNNLLFIIAGIFLVGDIIFAYTLFKPNISRFLGKKEAVQAETDAQNDPLLEEINPAKGVELGVKYGDLGPKMLKSGVIDLAKFKEVYVKEPLTEEQLNVLTKGSNEEIKITRENSHFLLNFFWAVGLANKTRILTEGEMMQEGDASIFASTGGWSLASGDPMNHYAKENLISLTPAQEEMVWEVASNIYRPCCDNSTAFPDCNHGMALLGLLELMAAQGASEQEMYSLAKYVNAYWFPPTYYDLAQYFKAREGKSFKDIDAKTILSKEFSSATGYFDTKKWLTDNGIIKEPPNDGGSCGV